MAEKAVRKLQFRLLRQQTLDAAGGDVDAAAEYLARKFTNEIIDAAIGKPNYDGEE